MTTQPTGSPIIPGLRYERAQSAIRFLCEAFGFERHLVVGGEGPEDVAHAQLTLGSGMVMLGTRRSQGDYDKQMRLPREAGGCTQGLYVVVDEVDHHYARAKAAGAEILNAPRDSEQSGRSYTCRDCEGHVWTFGAYNPWSPKRPDHS